MFSVVLNNARICWSFFYPPLSGVRSNLCNIWRYPLWSATYVIYMEVFTLATCDQPNRQLVWSRNSKLCTGFFLKYQLLYIRSALCVSVNLIQHASCNFPIFFSYATIHKVLLKVYLSIYIASLKYTKASTIHHYITTHNALIKS